MASDNVFDPDFSITPEELDERAPLSDPEASRTQDDADFERDATFASTVREDGSTPRSVITSDSDPETVSTEDSPAPGLDPTRALSVGAIGPDPFDPRDPNYADHTHTAADAAQEAAEDRSPAETAVTQRSFPVGTTAAQVLELERQAQNEVAESRPQPSVTEADLGTTTGAGAEAAPSTVGAPTGDPEVDDAPVRVDFDSKPEEVEDAVAEAPEAHEPDPEPEAKDEDETPPVDADDDEV